MSVRHPSRSASLRRVRSYWTSFRLMAQTVWWLPGVQCWSAVAGQRAAAELVAVGERGVAPLAAGQPVVAEPLEAESAEPSLEARPVAIGLMALQGGLPPAKLPQD